MFVIQFVKDSGQMSGSAVIWESDKIRSETQLYSVWSLIIWKNKTDHDVKHKMHTNQLNTGFLVYLSDDKQLLRIFDYFLNDDLSRGECTSREYTWKLYPGNSYPQWYNCALLFLTTPAASRLAAASPKSGQVGRKIALHKGISPFFFGSQSTDRNLERAQFSNSQTILRAGAKY